MTTFWLRGGAEASATAHTVSPTKISTLHDLVFDLNLSLNTVCVTTATSDPMSNEIVLNNLQWLVGWIEGGERTANTCFIFQLHLNREGVGIFFVLK